MPWTEEERDIAVRMAPDHSGREIAVALGKKEMTVRSQLFRWGIKVNGGADHKERWEAARRAKMERPKNQWGDPAKHEERRIEARERMKRQWADPNLRERRILGMRAKMATFHVKQPSTPIINVQQAAADFLAWRDQRGY